MLRIRIVGGVKGKQKDVILNTLRVDCIMSQALISIIVPVYKVEEYLSRCIESILAQTYNNIEIILVDDGSPDKCPEICDRFAEVDSRIKVIHKENGGVSSARNAGLEKSSGNYVMFVDSDDVLASNAVSFLYKRIRQSKAVLAIGGVTQVYPEKTIAEKKDLDGSKEPKLALEALIRGRIYPGCYAKLFSAKLAKSDRFDTRYAVSEDYYYLFRLISSAKGKIVIATTPNIYSRFIRKEGAIKTGTYFKGLHDVFDVNERIIGELNGASARLTESALYRYKMDTLNICLVFVKNGKYEKNEKRYLRSKAKKYQLALKSINGFSKQEQIIWNMILLGMWRTLRVLQRIKEHKNRNKNRR